MGCRVQASDPRRRNRSQALRRLGLSGRIPAEVIGKATQAAQAAFHAVLEAEGYAGTKPPAQEPSEPVQVETEEVSAADLLAMFD